MGTPVGRLVESNADLRDRRRLALLVNAATIPYNLMYSDLDLFRGLSEKPRQT